MNRISRLAAALFLIVLLGACRLFDTTRPGGLPAANTPAPVEATAPPVISEDPAPTDEAAIVLLTRSVVEESANPRYEIKVEWPELEWAGHPQVEAFNQAAEALAQEEIATFKQGVANTPDDPAFQEFSSSLTVGYTPTYMDSGLFSVRMNVGFYMAGAAHPAHYSHAINYDLSEGRVLSLEELFQPGSAYLETLSTYCLDDLAAQGTLAWEEGALPKAENFQDWNLTPGGLEIMFDEYQVAPYAAGPQKVLIPYERLKEVMNPEGPLAKLAGQ